MNDRRSVLNIFVVWPFLMMTMAFLFRALSMGMDGLLDGALLIAWRVILLNSLVGICIALLLSYPKVREIIVQDISILKSKQEPLWYFMHFGVSGVLVINLLTQVVRVKI